MIDAVVTGRSLPALQTALDLAEVGLRVVVLDGGTAEASKPWAERDPDGVIRAFAKRIATAVDQASTEEAAAARLVELPVSSPMLLQRAEWLPQAEPNVLGIPAVPLAVMTSAAIGSGGAFRAYLDRLTPLLTVGKTRMIGELVQKRMGTKAREQLVDPQIFERFGAESYEVEAAIAAPGLNEALSRAGSLSTAVFAYADRNVARETRVTPGVGAAQFADEVMRRLELYGVESRSEQAVSIAEEDGGWTIQLDGGETIKARALVADVGESASVNEALEPYVGAVLPKQARTHALMVMERPEWLPSGSRAIARVGDWAITLDSSFDTEAQAGTGSSSTRVSAEQQATTAYRLTFKASPASDQAAKLAELQAQNSVGAAKAHIGTGIGIEWLSGALLQEAAMRAAPYLTIADRDEAVNALAELEAASPNLFAVGRALHGDDQAVALAAAHASAVHLRRRLLGLTE